MPRDVIDPPAILRAAGLRRTPVRTAVIERLAASSRPASAHDLLAQLPDGTDAVTVYRTLNTLTRKRLARRVRGEDRSWRYELTPDGGGDPADGHVHAHFVCDACGTIECLPDVAVPAVPPTSRKLAEGYDVTKQEVTLHGTCPKCHDDE